MAGVGKRSLHEIDPALSWAYGEFNPAYRRLNSNVSDYDKKLGSNWAKVFGKEKIEKMVNYAISREYKETGAKGYRNLHGEFEARDSASRMLWDAEKRQMVRPYSSEIEPQSGWIVR